MFNYFRKELDWGGRKLVLETGKIARQADGAVMISYGETIVLCTAVGMKSAKPGQVEVKHYPSYRGAVARGEGMTIGSSDFLFWSLFGHIEKNKVEMTAPVK